MTGTAARRTRLPILTACAIIATLVLFLVYVLWDPLLVLSEPGSKSDRTLDHPPTVVGTAEKTSGTAAATASPPSTGDGEVRQPLPQPVRATIVGRCTMHGGGPEASEPLPGCRVTSGKAVARTTSDGSFRIEVRAPTVGQGHLVLAPGPDHEWLLKTSPFPLTAKVDVGEIRVPERVDFAADVTTVKGFPIEGVGIRMRRMLDPPNSKGLYVTPTRITLVAVSSSSGTLDCPEVATGTWSLEALGHYSVVEPLSVTVSRDRDQRVRIAVARIPPGNFISGIVLDEVGSPVADIDVTVMEFAISGRRIEGDCTTDADGRFRMRVKGNAKEVLSIQVLDPKRRFLASTHHGPFVLGKADIVVRVSRGHNARLKVLDATTRQPVERFRVRMYPNIGNVVDPGRGEYANGDVDLPHVKYGKATVVVEPEDRSYLPAGPMTLHFGGDALVARTVLLHRAVEMLVRVHDSRGHPVEGARARVLDARGGDPRTEHLPTLDQRELDLVSLLEVRSHAVVLVSGSTDEAGSVTLLVGRAGAGSSPGHAFVEVTRDGFVPSVQRLVDLQAAGGIVCLQRGATLVCRAVGGQEWTRQARVSSAAPRHMLLLASQRIDPRLAGYGLEVVLEESVPILERQLFSFDDAGEARIPGLPPGKCTINYVFRSPRGKGLCKVPIAQGLDLAPGAKKTVEFDLGELLEQVVSVRALLDGVPASGSSLDAFWCTSAEGAGQALVGSAQADAAGRVRTTLPAGLYRFRLRDGAVENPATTLFVSSKTYRIVPGKDRDQNRLAVSFRRRPATLRLSTRTSGSFAANRQITVVSGTMFKRTLTTGPDGTGRLPNAPGGPFNVHILCNFRRDAGQPWSEKARAMLEDDRIRNAFGVWVDSGLRLGPFRVPESDAVVPVIEMDASWLFSH